MAHEGVRGYGTFVRVWLRAAKRAATTVEAVQRQVIRKGNQATAPRKPSSWWRRG
jgi:hypothetical protein